MRSIFDFDAANEKAKETAVADFQACFSAAIGSGETLEVPKSAQRAKCDPARSVRLSGARIRFAD
jgi:hypothetical protein